MEIAEEEEEGDPRGSKKRQSTIEEKDHPGEIADIPARPRSPITGPPVTLDSNLATSPKESKFADTADPPSFTGADRPASPAKSFDHDVARRMSSQSARQEHHNSSLSYLHGKPRVMLGPRPSAEPTVRSSVGDTVRPVASMPAGLRLVPKGAKKIKTYSDDTASVISEAASEDTFLTPTAPAIPESAARPTTSSGASVKSLPASTHPVKQAMTPEKLRLMKALQLREKKKRASKMQPPPVPSLETPSASITELSNKAAEAVDEDVTEPGTRLQPNEAKMDAAAADENPVIKVDSAVDVASAAPNDHTSEHTQTDSRPQSPIGAPSEVGDSTQASSVSESTDETIQAQGDNEDQEKKLGELETLQPATGLTAGVLTLETESGNGPRLSTEGQEASQALPSQTDQQPDATDAEADEKDSTSTSAQKDDGYSESSFIPTSKFAKLPSGQAVMEPMESRGQDPLNVTSGPGSIDEADPGAVGPSERTEDDPAASPSKWNLPISKYSTHDSSKCLALSPIPAIVTSSAEPTHGQDNITAQAADTMDDATSAEEKKRSARPEPIQTGILPDKEDTPQQNGTVTDEPQSATVDDASSTQVASPVTATPPQPSEPPTPRMLRTVSTPVHSPHSTAGDAPPSAARSVSSGSVFQQRISQQQSSTTHLAPNRVPGKLAGGISSRIKAFEQLATKAPSSAAPVVSSIAGGRPSSAFFSVRQNSIRDGARSPSVLGRANSIYRGRTPGPDSDGSPETIVIPRQSRERSESVVSRMSVFEGGNVPIGRPETVQVTARIVREPGQSYPRAPESNIDPTDYPFPEFKQSPLTVDLHGRVETPEPAPVPEAHPVPTPLVHTGAEGRKSLQERRMSKDTKGSPEDTKDGVHRPGQRTSLTMARDFIRDSMIGKEGASNGRPPSVHGTSLLSRLSINTRRKSITQDTGLLSPLSVTEKSESGDEKGNRASRLMRRLSSTFSPGRKQSTTATSPTSPTLAEETVAERMLPPRAVTAPATAGLSSIVAYMGDVNVQFPENLLWKRRTMSLDSNGFLHLSPAQGAISSRERQLKRFHMSEFKPPYAPEIEMQELPNSVCLDFKTGSGLQIAFQDRNGQLKSLQGKHTPRKTRPKMLVG